MTESKRNSSVDVENPLISKIKIMLDKTGPDRWRRYDDEINPDQRFEKGRNAWERVYTLEIPNGTLVLRCSQPVRADYVAGGYALAPIGPERYLTEIRAKGWDAIELIDPYRLGGVSDKRCEVLAEGRIAQELFVLVASKVRGFVAETQKSFDAEIEDFLQKLPQQLRKMNFEIWSKKEGERGGRSYQAKFGQLDIQVFWDVSYGQENYYVIARRGTLVSRNLDWSLAKEVFDSIEKMEQHSGLLALSKVLGIEE